MALPGATITVAKGTYRENLNFGGRTLTLTSTDPHSPSVVTAKLSVQVNGDQANVAHYDGGGISCDQASPTISDNTISGNSATGDGGGIRLHDAVAAHVDRNIIYGNTAADGAGAPLGLRARARKLSPPCQARIASRRSSGPLPLCARC